jgi:hypothetical protein
MSLPPLDTNKRAKLIGGACTVPRRKLGLLLQAYDLDGALVAAISSHDGERIGDIQHLAPVPEAHWIPYAGEPFTVKAGDPMPVMAAIGDGEIVLGKDTADFSVKMNAAIDAGRITFAKSDPNHYQDILSLIGRYDLMAANMKQIFANLGGRTEQFSKALVEMEVGEAVKEFLAAATGLPRFSTEAIRAFRDTAHVHWEGDRFWIVHKPELPQAAKISRETSPHLAAVIEAAELTFEGTVECAGNPWRWEPSEDPAI